AYKGIPLVAATAIALAKMGCDKPFCFNRKEAKGHGEGGNTVGAPLKGRVLIVDDVISAGTSVRESVEIITNGGAKPCCVAISLDRMERGLSEKSAVEEVESLHGLPVISIANLDDLLDYLEMKGNMNAYLEKVRDYRNRYGAKVHG
ncbi:MAG TPA: orotate phosphoribosyltransferase, partial [Burkholderiales bacterium]|nr:orotate phosphoribosyltransferase [Burkholderiales bacterium]